jgi:RimJ/RimL family protein N-acetyltransferase
MPLLPVEAVAGERVTLDPLAVSDAAEMAVVLADPALYEFTGGDPPDADLLRSRYERQVAGASADGTEQWLNWILRTPEGAAAGYVQATVTDGGRTAEIAWGVGVPWQGRGYARDAARTLTGWLRANGVNRTIAHIHPRHAASAGVARAAGLVPTGELHDGEERWELPTTDRLGGNR